MPLGVTACSQKIFDAFYSDKKEKALYHGHSYNANPLACAAANASLQLLLDESCQLQIENIKLSHATFADILKNNDFVKEARQQGTILAIELNTKEDSSYFNTIRDDVHNFCLDAGVLLRPLGNLRYIMPPYCIRPDELEKVYQVITGVIDTFKNKDQSKASIKR